MRVRYDRRPKNPKLTIVFVHGIAASYLSWQAALKSLSADKTMKDVRLVAIDLIGFGRSPKPSWYKYNYKNYNRSLHRTLKKLRIKTPIILAGHSMGCLISADYAIEYPKHIKSLVLASPPFLRPSDLAKIPDKFYQNTYRSLKDHTDNVVIGTLASSISKVSSFDRRALNTLAFKETMENIILNSQNWDKILSLKLPIHIIHGHLDPLVVGANLRKLSRDSKYITLTESIGGHDIKPPKLAKVLRAIKSSVKTALDENQNSTK